MNISDLQVFVEVARLGNISKAAERLNYGQSNITTKIQRLEKFFGTPLFHRSRYGVILNDQGTMLLEQANQLLDIWEKTKEKIHGVETKRKLYLGSMETTAAVRLPKLLTEFHRTHPLVDLHLRTGTTGELVQWVQNHEIDGAFVAGSVKHKNIKSIPILKEKMVLITSRDNEALGPSFEPLQGGNLIVFRASCSYRKHLEKFLDFHHFVPSKILEFGSLDVIIGCVSAGMGVSLLPYSVVKSKEDVMIHELPSSFQYVDTHFIYHASNRNYVISRFIELGKRFFSDSVGPGIQEGV